MRRALVAIAFVLAAIVLAGIVIAGVGFQYACEPSPNNVISRTRPSPESYDLWGHPVVSPQTGTVKIDDALLRLARKAFYKETFRNELFLTDVLGVLNGPLRIWNVVEAVLALKGQGTTNLRVRVPETVIIGGHTFQKNSYFDTGLDVPRSAIVPLGIAISVS